MTKTRIERVRCPKCGLKQDVEVMWYEGAPWPDYVHECEKCGHVILESEWETVRRR